MGERYLGIKTLPEWSKVTNLPRPTIWDYMAGALLRDYPVGGGILNSGVGVNKWSTHWRDINDDVGLALDLNGNRSINWTHSF